MPILPRATPESQGVPCAAIAAFVDGAERSIQHLHSFMLLRHGHVIAEGWWHPYRAAAPHELYSLSKSFTSSAVGLAIAEGLLGLDDPVLKFFPAQAPKKISPNLKAMTVRHLLSMSTRARPGHHDAHHLQARPGQGLPQAARRARPRDALRLQQRRQLHAGDHRAAAHRPDPARLPHPAPARAARHPRRHLGEPPAHRRQLRRLGAEPHHRGHRPLRSALFAKGILAGTADPPRRLGRAGHRLAGRQRPGREFRLGAGLRPFISGAASRPASTAAMAPSGSTASSCPSRTPCWRSPAAWAKCSRPSAWPGRPCCPP